MSTISVSNIVTANGSESLTIRTGNTNAGDIVLPATGGVVIGPNSTVNSVIISTGTVANAVFTNATAIYLNEDLISTATISDASGNLRDVPQNSKSAIYTLIANDAGKHISTTANVAIPASVFSAGATISVYNNSAANITLTQSAGVTMYLAGSATTGNRTLAQRGLATVLCVAANTFTIAGAGLS